MIARTILAAALLALLLAVTANATEPRSGGDRALHAPLTATLTEGQRVGPSGVVDTYRWLGDGEAAIDLRVDGRMASVGGSTLNMAADSLAVGLRIDYRSADLLLERLLIRRGQTHGLVIEGGGDDLTLRDVRVNRCGMPAVIRGVNSLVLIRCTFEHCGDGTIPQLVLEDCQNVAFVACKLHGTPSQTEQLIALRNCRNVVARRDTLSTRGPKGWRDDGGNTQIRWRPTVRHEWPSDGD